MCGIAGVISWDDRYRVTRETLQRMSAAIAHRGPDGEAFYLNHEQEVTPDRPQCGFAFRRLAILDPDPRAMQPFTIGDKTIVFNGEIYNFRELREELKKLRPDYAWRTMGDAEVLILAFDHWDERCLERLNGMFAFAVWDDGEKKLFLARDRMGQKPLYYALGEDRIAFASELAALEPVRHFRTSDAIDDEALVTYLNLGYVDGGKTIYFGVRSLLPSTFLRGARTLCNSRYYRRQPESQAGRDAQMTRALVQCAVERQLVSDVPLGVFLSGGVDSSIIARCARTAGPLSTFSIGFDDPRYDESAYARAVARHLDTDHHEFRVKPDAVEDLPALARVFGEPFGDSSALPTHYLARETRKRVKVALSGDGGDELFGGYDRYRAMAIVDRFRTLLLMSGGLLSRAASLIPRRHPKSKLMRIGRILESVNLPPYRRYAKYMELFSYTLIDELRGRLLLDEQWVEDFESLSDTVELFIRHYNLNPVQAALATDRITYLPNDLLTKVDRASMLHGLEVRSPFMDHELVQFAAGLTTDQLLKGGPKRMLREAFADDLPAWVFKRKKMGFAVPIGEWFRGGLRPMLRDHLFASDSFGRQHFNMQVVQRLVDEHERQTVDHSQRLYALLMLELWWRTAR
jgi:asparagine synthase (glutamine-hydrolysing)